MAKLAKRGGGFKVRRPTAREGGRSLARRVGGAVVRRARAAGQRPKLSHAVEAGVSAATGAALGAAVVKAPDVFKKITVGPVNGVLTLGLAAAVLGTMVKPIASGKAGAVVRSAANAALAVGAATLAAEKLGESVAGDDSDDVGYEADED